jgi:hypothetical protein
VLRKALLTGQALAALLLAHPAASADVPRQVRLEYERQEGASACPEEAAIRTGVAGRLGYEPFRERAADLLRATLRRAGNQLEARIELLDGQGNLRAQRRLVSRGRDCAELAASVELAIAIAIDPMASAAPASPAVSPDAPATAARPERPRVDTAPVARPRESSAPAASPLGVWLAVAALGGVGSAPGPNAGLLLGGGIEHGHISLGLEARADLPASKELRAGQARAYLLAGSLVPCLHLDRAALCALATAGVRRVSGSGLLDERSATLAYVALGGRIGLELPLREQLSLTLHGDVTAPLTETRLTVDDGVVWTSPAVAVALALGLAMRFP